MIYYKSSSGGVDKVYAADNTTGKVTIILNYKGLGMYNVLNQRLSIDTPLSGKSDYDIYISSLYVATKSDFTGYVDLTKTFLNTL
jgi:hypothetical protein